MPSSQIRQSPSSMNSLSCAVLQAKNLSLNPKALFLLCTWHLLTYREVTGDRALQCHTVSVTVSMACSIIFTPCLQRARRWALSCNAAVNKGRCSPALMELLVSWEDSWPFWGGAGMVKDRSTQLSCATQRSKGIGKVPLSPVLNWSCVQTCQVSYLRMPTMKSKEVIESLPIKKKKNYSWHLSNWQKIRF